MSRAHVANFFVGMAGLAILRNWLREPDVASARTAAASVRAVSYWNDIAE